MICRYEEEKGQFKFNKGKQSEFKVLYRNDEYSLSHFLNTKKNRYALTLSAPDLVYHNKEFFEQDYKNAEEKFLKYIIKYSKLSDVKYEKISSKISHKEKIKLDKWPQNSLFSKVQDFCLNKKKNIYFANIDWFFCDDPNMEIADFIVADFTNKKIAFIHCKWGKGSKVSASAFHDLCSQAAKNLVYLHTKRYPPNINTWHKNAKWETTHIKKWIKGKKSLPDRELLWKKIKAEILNHPEGVIDVWLIIGDGLDCDRVNKLAREKTNNKAIGPMLHLLDGLVANCAEAGANLKVFGH